MIRTNEGLGSPEQEIDAMEVDKTPKNDVENAPHFAADPQPDAPAWEEIEVGRFMPRRIRGSDRGRALG